MAGVVLTLAYAHQREATSKLGQLGPNVVTVTGRGAPNKELGPPPWQLVTPWHWMVALEPRFLAVPYFWPYTYGPYWALAPLSRQGELAIS